MQFRNAQCAVRRASFPETLTSRRSSLHVTTIPLASVAPAPDAAPDTAPTPAAPALLSLGEVLTALSRALDLTEGQPAGHSVRSCAIALRLAAAAGLSERARGDLYYAMLLKDAGCSSNAARMAALFGADDRWVKPRMKAVDWHQRLRLALTTARTVGRGQSWRDRARLFAGIARTPDMTRELMLVRCDRGAAIARALGFGEPVAQAIRSLDEHWCGLGYPDGLRGEEIPLLSRLANLAQAVEVVHAQHGLDAAVRVARRRRGRWFDPRLVDLFVREARDRDWWAWLASEGSDATLAEPSADAVRPVNEAELDAVAHAFADIIDAKSPYTSRHSRNVASYACGIVAVQGADAAEQRRTYRAGLLHDIGKLGVSNRVLDKPGRLTDEERAEVELHPRYTWEILSRVRAFDPFAWEAAAHHEKLDGSGYPWRLTADALSPMARVLAVADIYEALTADRPYRAGMDPSAAFGIIARDRGPKLADEAVAALEGWMAG